MGAPTFTPDGSTVNVNHMPGSYFQAEATMGNHRTETVIDTSAIVSDSTLVFAEQARVLFVEMVE